MQAAPTFGSVQGSGILGKSRQEARAYSSENLKESSNVVQNTIYKAKGSVMQAAPTFGFAKDLR
jgi:hypothetical protein